MHSTPRTPKVAERVASRIVSHIVEDGLQAGDPLPKEHEAIELFGVARGTLREAMRLLETQGVILIRTGRNGGPVVRDHRPENLASSMSLILQLMQVPFDAVVEARTVIEPGTARLAAMRRSAGDLKQMGRMIEEMKELSDEASVRNAHLGFVHLIGKASRNDVLMINNMMLHAISASVEAEIPFRSEDAVATMRSYTNLVGALVARDPDSAERIARRRLASYRSYMANNYPDLLAQPVPWTSIS